MLQRDALFLLRAGSSAFITGAPGSGKTYVLGKFIQWARQHGKSVVVTASTGIAATHLNGQTIHSWSGVGISEAPSSQLLRNISAKNGSEIRHTDILVIDEVSMLSASFLDLIDIVCRHVRHSMAPFGGLQVVLAGDLFQLPPIKPFGSRRTTNPSVLSYLESYRKDGIDPYGFLTNSRVWKRSQMPVFYLTEQHRSAGILNDILGDIRLGVVTAEDRQALESRIGAKPAKDQPAVRMFPTNRQADLINQDRLNHLDGQKHTYHAVTNGDPFLVKRILSSMLAPEHLTVKKGAVVMALRNDTRDHYMNGSLGVVADFDRRHNDRPIVDFNNGYTSVIQPATWEMEEDQKAVAAVDQIPLRLAWAITIHKSQGMTLSAAQMDLSRTFAPGMGYVALSRVESLDGLFLDGISPQALTVSDEALQIDSDLRQRSEQIEQELRESGPQAMVTQIRELKQSHQREYEELLEPLATKSQKKSQKPTESAKDAKGAKSSASQPSLDFNGFPTGKAAF